MKDFIFWITAIFQILVFIGALYYLAIAFFGFYKKKEEKQFAPQKKFAMLVAAHDEEVVIAKKFRLYKRTIRSICNC